MPRFRWLELMRLCFLVYSDIACLGGDPRRIQIDWLYWSGLFLGSWVFLPVFVPATAAADGAVLIGGPSTWFLVGNKLFLGGEPTPERESIWDCIWLTFSLVLPPRAAVADSPVGAAAPRRRGLFLPVVHG